MHTQRIASPRHTVTDQCVVLGFCGERGEGGAGQGWGVGGGGGSIISIISGYKEDCTNPEKLGGGHPVSFGPSGKKSLAKASGQGRALELFVKVEVAVLGSRPR